MERLLINICSPKNENWGDAAFAKNLANEFNRLGIATKIACFEDWYKDSKYQVSLTISGKFAYKPNQNRKNLLWIISHPEIRTIEELNAFNHVFIASEYFHNLVKNDISGNSSVLNQATNFALNDSKKNKMYDLLFVGNNYYDNFPARKIIYDLNEMNRDKVKVIGKNWHKYLPKKNILADFLDYHKLPEIYSSAKIVLNDHHEYMRRFGFINNRAFDLAAIKQFQISDYVEGIDSLGIESYKSREELNEKINFYLNNEKERNRNAIITNKLCENNTFENVAKQIAKKI